MTLSILDRVVVFDYGEVLSRPPSEADRMAILAAAGIDTAHSDHTDAAAFWSSYWSHREALDLGSLSVIDYWLAIATDLATTWPASTVQALWAADFRSWISVEPGTLDLLAELHAGGTRLALLSNAGFDFGSVFRYFPAASFFERVFVSAERDLLKPDPAIYLEVAEALGITPDHMVFIDNKSVNTDAAARLGITVHHFTGPDGLATFLRALAARRRGSLAVSTEGPSVSALFEPITLRTTTFRNRVWVAPMCQYSVFAEDGVPTKWHLVHLGALATGGSALVMTEATAVTAQGRISPRDTGIWNDEQRDAWRPIVDFIHSQGALAGMQLAHAGRKGSTWPAWGTEQHGTVPAADGGWPTVSASAVAFGHYEAPEALDAAGIDEIVERFTQSAVRALDAGFDLLELHAAHGYLLHQFLSPISNLRDDEYGGSLENRARLLLRIVRSVREAIGDDRVLLVRFSATDWTDGGWDEQQTSTVAEWARDAGADLFDISSGGNVANAHIPLRPGYQVPFAEYVRAGAEVATSAVGLITEPRQAEEIIASGQADVVMLARELLRDPHWPLRAARELGADVDYWPGQYLRAKL